MQPIDSVSPIHLRLYSLLRGLRPITVGARLKRLLRIRRFYYRLPSGLVFWVDPVSNLGLFLLQGGTYDRFLSHALTVILRPGDSFLDVGANEGYFTIFAASLVGDSGHVGAVEPQSRLQEVLRRNIEANNFAGRVAVHATALSDKPGTLRLHLTPDINSGATSAIRAYRHQSLFEEVSTTTLDMLLEQLPAAPRLVKIDCEGAEPEILRGAAGTLAAQTIPFLLVEYHPAFREQSILDDTHQLVLSHGYLSIRLGPDHILYYLPGTDEALLSRVTSSQ